MDFIELTESEYKQNLREAGKYISKIKHLYEWIIPRGFMIALYWAALFFASPIAIRLLGIRMWTLEETLVFAAILLVLAFMLDFLIVTQSRKSHFSRYHRSFISKVNQLTPAQTQELLSEYPNRKRIDVYYGFDIHYGVLKKKLSPLAIYVTDNFLFVPGLFLIMREEIGNISCVSGVDEEGNEKRITRVEFQLRERRKRLFIYYTPTIKLPMMYDRKYSAETGEQILLWWHNSTLFSKAFIEYDNTRNMRKYCKVLGLKNDSSVDEIKKAYRIMVEKYHPDKNPGNMIAEKKFAEVTEAYTGIMRQAKNR